MKKEIMNPIVRRYIDFNQSYLFLPKIIFLAHKSFTMQVMKIVSGNMIRILMRMVMLTRIHLPLYKKTTRAKHLVPEEYASLGGPTAICSKCNARMWKEERVNKNVTKGTPIFSLCCMKGAFKFPDIPLIPRYLMDLYNDNSKGPAFHRMIRLYNAMFAFTFTGDNIDHYK